MLAELMRRGWPALAETVVDGWVARLADGVTRRSNSVLPVAEPGDVDAALSAVEARYAGHGLPAVFQVGPTVHPADLDDRLAERGYVLSAPTVVLVADVPAVLARLAEPAVTVRVTTEPDEPWLDLWWRVDGRGGPEARAVARRILTAGPARYASVSDAAGVAAVARLALVDDWGGLYCLAVRPDARRRGLAEAVTRALLAEAEHQGVRHCWLQVLADNEPARTLYAKAGFTEAGRYHYRTRHHPPNT